MTPINEIKKVFPMRTFIIAVVTFLVLNCINIYKNYHPAYISPDEELLQKGRVAVYRLLEGEIDEEKLSLFLYKYDEITEIVQSGNYDTSEADFEKYFCGYAYGDKNIFDEVYTEFRRQIEYEASVSKIRDEALDNMDFFKGIENSLLYAQNEYIFSHFDARQINRFYYTSPAISLFTYNLSTVLILLLILLLFSPIFSVERESEMFDLLCCTKRGSRKTVFGSIWTNKIKLLFSVVTILVLLFGVSDMVCLKLCLKFNGLFQPIFVIEEFQNTSLTCSIFSFWILNLLFKWFGFIIIGLMVIAVSKTQKSSAFSYIISLVSVALCMFINVIPVGGIGDIVNLFNPISMFIIYKDFASFEMMTNSRFFLTQYMAVILGNICSAVILLLSLFMLPRGKVKIRRGVIRCRF